MALAKAYTDTYGTTHSQSYWRVERITLNKKDDNSAEISISCYADAASKLKQVCERRTFLVLGDDYAAYFDATNLDLPSENPIKSAYEFLKTQLFFQDATDV